MSPRRSPLILAWALVAVALAAALVYAVLPPPATPPVADAASGRGEVQISLADVPTLAEPAPQTAAAAAPASPQASAAAGADGGAPPKIAVVVSGLGLSQSNSLAAIQGLPAAVTLSFTPYSEALDRWVAAARAAGHEVMIDLPMEPVSFPSNDPGPKALISSLPAAENRARLDWVLGRADGIVGVTATMGSRFSQSRELMTPVLQTLKARGLLYLDNRATAFSEGPALAAEIGLTHAVNDRSLDENHASQVVIDARLAQLERVALTEGAAVAIAQPFPLTLERLATWSETLAERGFILVPISAVAK